MSEPHYESFGPDANCTLAVCDVSHSLYRYRPSLAANTTFIALFSVLMAAHIALGFRWKTWWFMWCMVLGCSSEIIGYIGRVMMWINPFSFTAFMIQIGMQSLFDPRAEILISPLVCVTSAPVYFCAAIYVTLAVTYVSSSPQSPLSTRPHPLTRT